MRFDVCAHTYDEHAGPQRFFAERVAQFVAVGPHDLVVELGAGTGALTRLLQSKVILATDASPKMVDAGRIVVPHAQWLVADAFDEWTPLGEIQVSSGLLHWSEEPVSTLMLWKKRVHPNGRMVHAVPCEPCLKEWRALVPESPVSWRSEEEWRGIFQDAGLRVTRSQVWTHEAVCASALELVRGFHRTGVTGRVHVGAGRLRKALRQYDATQRVSGGVRATWAWLAIEAV